MRTQVTAIIDRNTILEKPKLKFTQIKGEQLQKTECWAL